MVADFCQLTDLYEINQIPHPPPTMVPFSSWVRAFQSSADSTIYHWARVFRFFPKQSRLQLGESFPENEGSFFLCQREEHQQASSEISSKVIVLAIPHHSYSLFLLLGN